MGDLHAEHLVDLQDILRQGTARPEQAASGLGAGQHCGAHMTAGDMGRCYRVLLT